MRGSLTVGVGAAAVSDAQCAAAFAHNDDAVFILCHGMQGGNAAEVCAGEDPVV